MYVSFTTVARTGNERDLFYYLKIKSEGEFLIFYFFGNIFPKLTSSVCNNIYAKRLCSGTLRFKCKEISEVLGIWSELNDSVPNARR